MVGFEMHIRNGVKVKLKGLTLKCRDFMQENESWLIVLIYNIGGFGGGQKKFAK